MDVDLAALPDDVDALHRLIRNLAAARLGEQTKLSEAQAEIERLRLIVQKLQRLQFGRRAERLDDGQLELGLEDLGADLGRAEELLPLFPVDQEPAARDRSDRPSLPEHLERKEVSLDLEVKACPCCGGALHLAGETVSEMLDWVAGSAAGDPYPPAEIWLPQMQQHPSIPGAGAADRQGAGDLRAVGARAGQQVLRSPISI